MTQQQNKQIDPATIGYLKRSIESSGASMIVRVRGDVLALLIEAYEAANNAHRSDNQPKAETPEATL